MADAAAVREPLHLLDVARNRPFPFLLEGNFRGGRPVAGSDPSAVLIAKRDRVSLWRAGREERRTGDPFETLRELFEERRGRPGHAVGWLGYDLGAHVERLPRRATDDLEFPDLLLCFHDRPAADPRAIDPDAYREAFGGLRRAPVPRTFTKDAYVAAIARAKEYVAAGDIYQVNLSQRFEVAGSDPLGVYARLREPVVPAYAAFLECGDRAILSSSPEQFLEVRGRRIVTRPIKGTRPRGRGPEEDERLRRELLDSPKDDAELAMIVDLERNDLGRVCEYGSVQVEEPKALETHPTVHHLSATVAGTLREGVGPADVLRATFPGGSVTGAPKIRAMEIIDELEPTRRGVYTGAFGWIGFDGSMDLAVAIRVLHFDRDRFGFQVGGAIVADSDPEEEYRETLVKAAGMAKALGLEWNTSP
ncbi:MAG: aminodeoxychorismate synthase component I [Planctomycetes bacterium]|nr:aminodeoxychorismate synthase component I [Planctomycetota bacterium]